MLFDYGFSLIGKSHIAKGTCCQDKHKIKKLGNGWHIAAIADGVGSAVNSQIGSKIATETVVEMCEELMPWDYNTISIKSMMRTVYNYAFKRIMNEAEKTGNPIESYDTTLSMVIYDGHKIIYGHSGDGAIIGMNSFGNFVEITKPQKGPDGVTVIPLRSGYTQWKIDTYEEELAAVLLVTDGMRDILCHYLLMLEESKEKIYTPLISFFMDPVGVSKIESVNESLKKKIEAFLNAEDNYDSEDFYYRLTEIYKKRTPQSYVEIVKAIKEKNYPIGLMQGVQDDKTVVGLINTDILVDNRDNSFYSEPDWDRLQEAWNRKAYPHLYKDEQPADEGKSIDSSNPKSEETEVAKKKDEFVSFSKVYETEKAKVAMEAYAKTSGKIIKAQLPEKSGAVAEQGKEEKKDGLMDRHEKPKRQGWAGKIGDLFE